MSEVKARLQAHLWNGGEALVHDDSCSLLLSAEPLSMLVVHASRRQAKRHHILVSILNH